MKAIQGVAVKWVIPFLWTFCFFSAIFRPILNDNMVFWSWAQLVNNSPLHGLDAIESVWEIKGLLSRIIYYQLYVITRLFVSDLYPYGQYVYQAIGYIEMCLVLGLSLYLVPNNLLSNKDKKVGFYLTTIGLFTLTPEAALQPEEWSICLLMLSMALLLRANMVCKVAGGVLLGLTFFIKTPLILLAGSVFFAVSLLKNKNIVETIKEIWIYALTSLLTIVLLLIVLQRIYPNEIQDIIDASYYQSTIFRLSFIDALRSIDSGWQKGVLMMPMYLPILIIGILSFLVFLTTNSLRDNMRMLCLWFFPCFYVIASNCYFQYHFVVFLFPVFISIALAKQYWCSIDIRQICLLFIVTMIVGISGAFHQTYFLLRLFLGFFCAILYVCMALVLNNNWRKLATKICLCYALFVYVSWNSLVSYSRYESTSLINDCVSINKAKGYCQNRPMGNEPILQLNCGTAPAWMNNPSYLRHFYPLPIQRTPDSTSFTFSDTYLETKKQILTYDGDYVVIDTIWFYQYPHNDIKEYIGTHFHLSDSICIPTIGGCELFSKHPAKSRYMYIYEKTQ